MSGQAAMPAPNSYMFAPDLELMPRKKLLDLQLSRLRQTLASLEAFRPWFFGFGLALPLVLATVGFFAPMFAFPLFAAGGLSSAIAGAALKFVLVDRAGYNQGFALTSTPTRGGLRAGQPIKPGWSMSCL